MADEGQSRNGRRRFTALLVGFVLAVTGTCFFVALAAVFDCADCARIPKPPLSEPVVIIGEGPATRRIEPASPRCRVCLDSRRVTLYRKWRRISGWEGKLVAVRAFRGFRKTDTTIADKTAIQIGKPITKAMVEEARETLLGTGAFDEVRIEVSEHADTPGQAKVLIIVVESPR